MPTYLNLSGNSAVTEYQTGPDYIDVTFQGGSTYRYTVASAGRDNIAAMKEHASAGQGLNTYINKYARKLYSARLR